VNHFNGALAMKRLRIGLLAMLSAFVTATIAQSLPAEDASSVIDKAIKAVGGEAKLSRLKAVTLPLKSRFHYGNRETNFSGECSVLETDKLLILGESDGVAMRGVFNPLGVWAKFGEQVEEARAGAVPAIRKGLYALRTAQMLLPLKDKVVTLSPAWDGQVGDRPALLVKATHKDHGDLLFYFDKQTGLPAKVESRVKLSIDQLERSIDFAFSDFKEFDGLMHFTKIAVTGDLEFGEKLNMEITLSDLKPKSKLDESLFDKP